MTEVHSITVEAKERAGKGAARATRRDGRVPGVIYGDKKAPTMISLDPRDLAREIKSGHFFSTIYDVQVGSEKARVLARDLQLHPVTDHPIHVDFLRVSAETRLNVEVPVSFLNAELCPGLKRGGLLNIVRHEVEVYCKADAIPQEFEVDLAALDLDIGDTVHVSAITLPPGVTLTITDRDFTIATIAAPTVMAEEAAEGEEEEEAAERKEGEEEEEEEESKED